MAVNTGQRRETAYRNHVYVQGNTARRRSEERRVGKEC